MRVDMKDKLLLVGGRKFTISGTTSESLSPWNETRACWWMGIVSMFFQMMRIIGRVVTISTFVRFDTSKMNPDMTFQGMRLSRGVVTMSTLVGFDPGVDPHVNFNLITSLSFVLTERARVWSFSSMRPHVHIQMGSLVPGIVTEGTFEWFFS